jgi:hypothetical protein
MNARLNYIYVNMKERCCNPNCKNYKNYGGKGITVCEEWLNKEIVSKGHKMTKGWIAFRDWALSNGYRDDLTIDRIDATKGYSPDNCRWVSQKVQQNNRSNNRLVTYKGKTQTLSEWCDELHLNYKTVSTRINNYHWSVERAFEEAIGNVPDMATFQGRTQSIKGWCKELNISVFTVRTRLRSGWTIEKALGTRPRRKVR